MIFQPATPEALAELAAEWGEQNGDEEAETVIRHGRDGIDTVYTEVGADLRILLRERAEAIESYHPRRDSSRRLYAVDFRLRPGWWSSVAGCLVSPARRRMPRVGVGLRDGDRKSLPQPPEKRGN